MVACRADDDDDGDADADASRCERVLMLQVAGWMVAAVLGLVGTECWAPAAAVLAPPGLHVHVLVNQQFGAQWSVALHVVIGAT